MLKLEIHLLGTPQFYLDGTPLDGFVTRKAQALLLYLIGVKRPLPRGTLATMFWPEGSDRSASNNLRRVLPNLRKLVGSHLIIDRQEIAFDRSGDYWLDVDFFTDALRFLPDEARDVNAAPVDDEMLEAALSLYTDEFLAGFHVSGVPAFEEWVLFEREHLRGLAIHGLDVLADRCLQRGDIRAGLRATQRLLALEPWYESAHRQQMALLARSGQRTAALTQYEKCRAMLADEFGLPPSAETTALYRRIQAGEVDQPVSSPSISVSTSDSLFLHSRDLDNIPRQSLFIGRRWELDQLRQWHQIDRCALISILGVGGEGKTTLTAHYARSLFEQTRSQGSVAIEPVARVLWQSLVNAPPFSATMRLWLQAFSGGAPVSLPETVDEQLTLLFDHLRGQRCLLVLDNLESILEEGTLAGQFRESHQEYGLLLQRVGELTHQSCLLLTSREAPLVVSRLARTHSSVRLLSLTGLETEAGMTLLERSGMPHTPASLAKLVARYSGNPLALTLVADTVLDLFGGDIEQFLESGASVFDDIRAVLDQQFARLFPLEIEVLTWLAIEREAVSLEQLLENWTQPPPRPHLVEALRSLQRRSLVEQIADFTTSGGEAVERFKLQNVVMEYATTRLIQTMGEELDRCASSGSDRMDSPPHPADDWFNRFALVKVHAREYVRLAQEELILEPLARRFVASYGTGRAEAVLKSLLHRLHAENSQSSGYAAANLLHLARALAIDVAGWDFSGLAVRQADLRWVPLVDVDFSDADLSGSRFAGAFTAVLDVAFSPDGAYLAAATTNGEAVLWHADALQPHLICQASRTWLWSVAFSEDGGLLAAGGADYGIYLFDTRTGLLLDAYRGHKGMVRTVLFDNEHEQVISGGLERQLCFWDIHTGVSRSVQKPDAFILSMAAADDQGLLATGEEDGMVQVRALIDGAPLYALSGHERAVTALAFAEGGRLLASGGADHTVRLWDVSARRTLKVFHPHAAIIRSLAFHPQRPLLAVGYEDGLIYLWNTAEDRIEQTISAHTAVVWSLAFSLDGATLASGSNDYSLRLWDVETGRAIHALQGYNSQLWAIAPLEGGRIIASASGNGRIRFHDREAGTIFRMPDVHEGAIRALAVSPGGRMLASGGVDQSIRLWDVGAHLLRRTLNGHTGAVFSLAFSPDGRLLASAGGDHTVRLWRPLTGQHFLTLTEPQGRVSSVAFSADGALLAAGGYEHTLHIWDVSRPDAIHLARAIHVEAGFITYLTFSPADSTLAVVGATSRNIALWDTASGVALGLLTDGHSGAPDALAFSPSGRMLASGGVDQGIALWDMAKKRLLRRMEGHQGAVRSLFWLDEETLCSSAADATIRIWHAPSGELLSTLEARGPYAGLKIGGATGLSMAQREALIALGAREE
jgi:WD40 repeat protein/DNA-binding SARP family transcriptional activator